MADVEVPSDTGSILTQKIGPLPAWAWGVGVLALAYAYRSYATKKTPAKAKTSPQTVPSSVQPFYTNVDEGTYSIVGRQYNSTFNQNLQTPAVPGGPTPAPVSAPAASDWPTGAYMDDGILHDKHGQHIANWWKYYTPDEWPAGAYLDKGQLHDKDGNHISQDDIGTWPSTGPTHPAALTATAPQAPVPVAAPPSPAGNWITVMPWNASQPNAPSTLSGLALQAYGDASQWPRIWSAPQNADLVSRRGDPSQIQAGDKLWAPS